MRTNIEIDDALMERALEASGLPTKKAVVEEALQRLVRGLAMDALLDMRGKVEFWEGYDPEEGDDEHEGDW